MGITVRALECLTPGDWLTEPGNRNEGALRAKGGPQGARFYYRYRDAAGRYDDLPLGTFDASGKRGMTLAEVRERVRKLRERYLTGDTNVRTVLEAEQRESDRQRETAVREAEEEETQNKATLGALLIAYVAQLKRAEKPSARSVERALERNVQEAWPKLWVTPASRVTPDDLLAVVARIADADKFREAAKVRSYLRAAFAAAIRARQSARGLAVLRDLRITTNPARDLTTVEGASNARERNLSVAELRAYWKHIIALADPAGALLKFHLLTGGQRLEQLGRLKMDDFDTDLKSVRLRDKKGRRKVPRIHDVPLIPKAVEAMRAMHGGALGPHLFTVTQGKSGAVYATAQNRLRHVVAAMAEAGELQKGAFTLGDLRRTVETRLAAAGVSAEVRAQLQSHGLGGIQARHYDRHSYMAEKREALETLHRILLGSSAKVVPIKRRA
jgi:Phage integrase family